MTDIDNVKMQRHNVYPESTLPLKTYGKKFIQPEKIKYIKVRCTAYIPIMFLLDQMISSSESDKMCIVRRCGNRHATCAAHVRVTQLVGQHLNLISTKVVVIPQHVVV